MTYCITGSLYFLISFTGFAHPASGNLQSSLCVCAPTLSLSLSLCSRDGSYQWDPSICLSRLTRCHLASCPQGPSTLFQVIVLKFPPRSSDSGYSLLPLRLNPLEICRWSDGYRALDFLFRPLYLKVKWSRNWRSRMAENLKCSERVPGTPPIFRKVEGFITSRLVKIGPHRNANASVFLLIIRFGG